jgi:hypothetical protein
MTGHHLRRLAVLTLLVLLALGCVQQAHAGLAILWRATVVSWDSPVTQLQDEAASQGAVHDDPVGHARARLAAAIGSTHMALPATPDRATQPALDAALTRAPPVSRSSRSLGT